MLFYNFVFTFSWTNEKCIMKIAIKLNDWYFVVFFFKLRNVLAFMPLLNSVFIIKYLKFGVFLSGTNDNHSTVLMGKPSKSYKERL